jgi:hypothetical protein
MPAFVQLKHGCFLSHRTFLFRHVTQLRGFRWGAVGEVGFAAPFDLDVGFWVLFWVLGRRASVGDAKSAWLSGVESDIVGGVRREIGNTGWKGGCWEDSRWRRGAER